MINHSRVSRKDVGEDRIAICSVFGCEFLKRVKPLKFGFLGFGKYPKCKKHGIPLVYIDDHIGQFIDSALACLYDKAGLPSKDLVSLLKVKYPKEMVSFVQGWVYCMSTGRGAPALSRYLDSISKAYMKNLKRKQVKAIKYETSDRWEYQALRKGRKELGTQYARFLKHLRIYEEVLVDVNKLKPLSGPLRIELKEWQDDIIKNYSMKNRSINTDRMTLIEVKQYYDQILNIGTCRCLIGLDPEVKTLNLTALINFQST